MASVGLFLRLVLIAGLSFACVPVGAWDSKAMISLAHDAIRAEVNGDHPPKPSTKSSARPVFVTIEIKGRVVGCRGDLVTRAGSLEEEIILAARAAAKHDPRYTPLSSKDLARILVTVTVIDRMEPIEGVDALAPSDGLVLKCGTRVGVVLPWEGKEPKTRLSWAYKKAGVEPGASIKLYKLQAERYRG